MGMVQRLLPPAVRVLPTVLNAYLASASSSAVYTSYRAPAGASWAFTNQAFGATIDPAGGGIVLNQAGAYLIGVRVAFANGSGNIGAGFVRAGSVQTPFNFQAGVANSPIHQNIYVSVTAGEIWSPAIYCSVSPKTPSTGDTATAIRLWAVKVD